MILIGMSMNGKLVDVHLTQDVDLEKKLFFDSMESNPLSKYSKFLVFGPVGIIDLNNPLESYTPVLEVENDV